MAPMLDQFKFKDYYDAFKRFLIHAHTSDLQIILLAPDDTKHHSLNIDFLELLDFSPEMAYLFSRHFILLSSIFDLALVECQCLIKDQHEQQSPRSTMGPMAIRRGPINFYDTSNDAPPTFSVKYNCHVRLGNIHFDELCRNTLPRSRDVGSVIQMTGTVVRSGQLKLLQKTKTFICQGCKGEFQVASDHSQFGGIPKPMRCLVAEQDIDIEEDTAQRNGNQENHNPSGDPSKARYHRMWARKKRILDRYFTNYIRRNQEEDLPSQCTSGKFSIVDSQFTNMPDICQDYQELKLQEQIGNLSMGTLPRSITVLLTDDLVDSCKAGDDITVIGIVIRRWKSLNVGGRCEMDIALVASHILVNNEQRSQVLVNDDLKTEFKEFWRNATHPLRARDEIVGSFCPHVYGLAAVKLAIMLILIGGVVKEDQSGTKVRGEAHLLLVGDPGTAKSQFLKYAAQLVPRSVVTTGVGTTTAGLTVTAVKDSGEWQLEAGALVFADRGLCCIDEFAGIRPHDRTAIHEAMEQQTLSVAKAGLVCKLNTRCSILAATNPKSRYDPSQSVSANISLASPLLSRFDLVLILLDKRNSEWDDKVSNYILENLVDLQEDTSWSLDKLKAYISHVKSSFQPKMTYESRAVLTKYYQKQREMDFRNAARTTIRMLESLIRLAQAHAKLMFRNEVTVQDAVIVVYLMEVSIESNALIEIPSSVLTSGFPTNPDMEYRAKESRVLERLGLSSLINDDPMPLDGIPENEPVEEEEEFRSFIPRSVAEIPATGSTTAIASQRHTNYVTDDKTMGTDDDDDGLGDNVDEFGLEIDDQLFSAFALSSSRNEIWK